MRYMISDTFYRISKTKSIETSYSLHRKHNVFFLNVNYSLSLCLLDEMEWYYRWTIYNCLQFKIFIRMHSSFHNIIIIKTCLRMCISSTPLLIVNYDLANMKLSHLSLFIWILIVVLFHSSTHISTLKWLNTTIFIYFLSSSSILTALTNIAKHLTNPSYLSTNCLCFKNINCQRQCGTSLCTGNCILLFTS